MIPIVLGGVTHFAVLLVLTTIASLILNLIGFPVLSSIAKKLESYALISLKNTLCVEGSMQSFPTNHP